MEENTNIDVLEETKENYLWLSEYAKAHVNMLEEVPHSYEHQGNPKLDQTMYIIETRNHKYVDLEVAKILSRVYAFCEEEEHAIMDCPFVPFHLKTNITRHVELQNVAWALMDQSNDQDPKILIV